VSEHARLERGDRLWLASLLLVGCLALVAFTLNARASAEGQGDTLSLSEGGVPLDDAWIHFQFARNLARGDGLSFNPRQPTSGSTAPLWTLLLAAVYLAGGQFPIAGEVLSAVCYLATLVATYALGKQLTGRRWAAWLAGMVIAVNGRMVWAGLSALEICLFAALSLVAIGMHLTDRSAHRYRLRTAALFGLAALSRPEGYLLFALSLADYTGNTVRATHHASRITSYVSRLVCQIPFLPILLFVLIILPYLLFSYQTSGHLLPNTYHAKATFGLLPDREFRDFLGVGATYLILDNPLLLPFFLFGLILLIRRAPLLSLWCMGLPLAYAFLRASLYQHGRYLMPLIPCNAVVAAWGLLEAEKLARRRGWWRWPTLPAPAGHPPREQRGLRGVHTRSLAVLASLLIIMGTAWRLPEMASLYARNVEDINRMHVALGHWVKENTPPDAILALNDIGAIAYISERPVIDLAGLVTPEVTPALRTPEQTDQLVAFLAKRDVAYVIIFPNWFPGLAARSDVLEEVHRVTLEDRSITGGETMVVYRAHWRR
jgi:arabinofuranosyltransferase